MLRNRLSSADASHVILTPLRSGSYSHPHFIREEMEAQREPAQYHTARNRWRRGLNQRVCTAEPCPRRQVKPQGPEPGISEALLDYGRRALGNHRRALSRRKTWSGSLFTEGEQMGGPECRQRASLRPALAPVPFILQCSLPFQSKSEALHRLEGSKKWNASLASPFLYSGDKH